MDVTLTEILASLGEKVIRIERLEAELAAARHRVDELETQASVAGRFDRLAEPDPEQQ